MPEVIRKYVGKCQYGYVVTTGSYKSDRSINDKNNQDQVSIFNNKRNCTQQSRKSNVRKTEMKASFVIKI